MSSAVCLCQMNTGSVLNKIPDFVSCLLWIECRTSCFFFLSPRTGRNKPVTLAAINSRTSWRSLLLALARESMVVKHSAALDTAFDSISPSPRLSGTSRCSRQLALTDTKVAYSSSTLELCSFSQNGGTSLVGLQTMGYLRIRYHEIGKSKS
jgi:hypothetical protein